MTDRIKLAVQSKGRIGNVIPEFLRRAGFKFELFERQLVSRCSNFPLDLIFVRHGDIPTFVEDNAADLGIVGRDLLLEENNDVEQLLPLGIGACTLCLAVPENSGLQKPADLKGKRIATSFPTLTIDFFNKERIAVDIVPIKGSVEIGPRLEIAEAISDLVGTGTTLQMNRMRIIAEIMESQAVLIGNKAARLKKSDLVEEILFRFESVIKAADKKLLMFTIPKDLVQDVKKLRKGESSLTISDVNGGTKDKVAVQMIVCEQESWSLMKKIKELGGEAVIVMDIERLVA